MLASTLPRPPPCRHSGAPEASPGLHSNPAAQLRPPRLPFENLGGSGRDPETLVFLTPAKSASGGRGCHGPPAARAAPGPAWTRAAAQSASQAECRERHPEGALGFRVHLHPAWPLPAMPGVFLPSFAVPTWPPLIWRFPSLSLSSQTSSFSRQAAHFPNLFVLLLLLWVLL